MNHVNTMLWVFFMAIEDALAIYKDYNVLYLSPDAPKRTVGIDDVCTKYLSTTFYFYVKYT